MTRLRSCLLILALLILAAAGARAAPVARAGATQAVPTSSASKSIAAAQAGEPDWSKDYAGKASGDIETRAKPLRFVRGEWRANRLDDGKLLTEWEVRIADSGEVIRWGTYRRYHPNGRLAVLGAYRNGQAAGVWMWLDETGQVMRRTRQQADYEDDLASDPLASPRSQFRNTAGQVSAEGQLKQDKPHGLWTYFYDHGEPKAQGRYLTGVPDGAWSYFYADGQLEKQVVYTLGVPTGPYRIMYSGGQERERGQYNAGVRTGLWSTFHENGQKASEGFYREDRRDGEWKAWDETGRLSARTVYAQDNVQSVVEIPAQPEAPEPLVSDSDTLRPPHLLDAEGRPLRSESDWDSTAQASDADGNPVPLAPPPVRRTRPPPLSRWTSPTGGEAKSSLP